MNNSHCHASLETKLDCHYNQESSTKISLGQEDSLEEENGNALQYYCLKNSMDKRSPAGYSPWGHKELDIAEWLSTHSEDSLRGGNALIW